MSKTFSNQFDHAVFSYSCSHALLEPGDRVLVAVSGGPDSVALLSWFCEYRSRDPGIVLGVIHVHHGLRGQEADEDATFVEGLSDSFGLPFFLRKIRVLEYYRAQKGESLQAIAHRERYRSFLEVAAEFQATKVALGHTQDDQAETVLMWMLRGAGANGLAGMPAHRPPFFIRPFLGVTRQGIEAYLSQKGMAFRVDSSNAKPCYLRNRIRQELVPVLKGFNPNLVEVLARQSDILRDETQYLDEQAALALKTVTLENHPTNVVISRVAFLQLARPIRRRVLLRMYRGLLGGGRNLPYDVVEAWMDLTDHGQSGALLRYKGMELVRDYEVFRFTSQGDEPPVVHCCEEVALPVPGAILWPATRQRIGAQIGSCPSDLLKASPEGAYFDAGLLSHSHLRVRSWKPGDVFYPFGLRGKRKKIQDLFSDIKVSRAHRGRVPIVEAPEGILWVGGYRMDHRFRVRDETRQVLALDIGEE